VPGVRVATGALKRPTTARESPLTACFAAIRPFVAAAFAGPGRRRNVEPSNDLPLDMHPPAAGLAWPQPSAPCHGPALPRSPAAQDPHPGHRQPQQRRLARARAEDPGDVRPIAEKAGDAAAGGHPEMRKAAGKRQRASWKQGQDGRRRPYDLTKGRITFRHIEGRALN